MTEQAVEKIESIPPRNDLRFFAVIDGRNWNIDDATGSIRREERHLCLELKMVSDRKPGFEPGATDESKSALAIHNAAAMEKGRHDPVGPTAQKRHFVGFGQTITHDEIGSFTQSPKAFEIGWAMLAVAIKKEKPLHRIGQLAERVMQRGGLAMMRPGKGKNLGTSLFGQQGGLVAAAVVDHGHRKTGASAA